MLFRIYQQIETEQIKNDDFVYLTKVLRLNINDKFETVDGTDKIKVYKIKSIDKKHLESDLIETYQERNEPEFKLTIAQAFPKGEKLELILQKCTEIGVTSFLLFESHKSRVKIKNIENKLSRWEKIIKSAVCQSRRNYKPEIKVYTSLELLLKENNQNIYYADQTDKAQAISNINNPATIIIGPESGFSDKEKELLINTGQEISLGKRTLRTETAAIAVCAKLLI